VDFHNLTRKKKEGAKMGPSLQITKKNNVKVAIVRK